MLRLIKSENFNKPVKDQEKWRFDIENNGIYIISISAKCKNWLQNFKLLFNDDDLAVQIDDYLFAEIKGKKREFTSAGSWNGNQLKNTSKKVLFILPLKAGTHEIKFWVDKQPYLESIKIYEAGLAPLLEDGFYEIGDIAAMDVILKNVKIDILEVEVMADKKSKLSLKVDGQIQENINYKKYKKWYWYGEELQGNSKKYQLTQNWVSNIHSLEFSGVGQPKIKSLKIKLRDEELKYKIGKIKIYKDIISFNVGIAYLREKPKDNSKILAEPKDGDELEIINERIEGDYMTDYGSLIWHEVIYQDKKGFILSTLVEIEGQERKVIIDLIREKCWQYGVDQNIILAIAGRESHYKPYQESESDKICRGIFQLSADTADYLGITDSYDIYQNIDGGVRYWKEIEGKFNGRGKILERRLAAWHDGPNADHISEGAKIFIKNVLANIEKKNWHNIISLPILILVAVGVGLYLNSSIIELPDFSGIGYALNLEAAISERPINKVNKFPAVVWDKNKNQILFFNSFKNFVDKIDTKILNIDGQNSIYISDEVLENPKNVFYFFVAGPDSCGASNCHFIFYRFNTNESKLEVINKDIRDPENLYLSPNLQKLAIVSSESGGTCLEGNHLYIVNLLDFKEREVVYKYANLNLIKNILWRNDQEIEFGLYSDNVCGDDKAERSLWLYNIDKQETKRLKSEKIFVNNQG